MASIDQNLLGAGQWKGAVLVTKLALVVTNAIMMTCSVIVFFVRKDFARIYTDDDRVAETVAGVTTVYVFFVFLGGSTQCLRGVLSGCGRQSDNARVSLVASYCVGLPISYFMCFKLEWGLAGLWLGLVVSNVFRTFALGFLVFTQDWAEVSRRAREKAMEKMAGSGTEAESKPLASSTGSDSDDEDEASGKAAP